MTDRELLEQAARAIGVAIEYRENGNHFASSPIGQIWNPLTDDTDAFRLAHKLGLLSDVPGPRTLEETRRAIVRAAAEIGKATP